jgi:calcium-dependent protein kinase
VKKVDIDGSGDIDYKEFLNGAISSEKMLSEDRLEKAFRLFDANNDNQISMPEIRAVLD